MKVSRLIAFVVFCYLMSGTGLFSEDYETEEYGFTDTAGIDMSGWVEMKSSVSHARDDSPLYVVQFMDESDVDDFLSSASTSLFINGDFTTRNVGAYFKSYANYGYQTVPSYGLSEVFLSVKILDYLSLQGGKIVYAWGKGYAFNAVGYVNPAKDPDAPDAIREGVLSIAFEAIKSFDDSLLQTIALNLIVLPGGDTRSVDYWETQNTEVAAKAYAMIAGMDIDVMVCYCAHGSKKAGMDIALNPHASLEIHGEASYETDGERKYVSNGVLETETDDFLSYLVGMRYAATDKVSVILEYFHNGYGMSAGEYSDYSGLLESAPTNAQILTRLTGIMASLESPAVMRDYAYAKISMNEPFDILYFVPSITTRVNLNDFSFAYGLQLSYKPFTNTEFNLQVSFSEGMTGTEFGDKSMDVIMEVGGKVFF